MDIVGDGDSGVSEDDVEFQIEVAGVVLSEEAALVGPSSGFEFAFIPKASHLSEDGERVVLV